MEQQHDGGTFPPRFAVENLDTVDLLRPMVCDDRNRLGGDRAMRPCDSHSHCAIVITLAGASFWLDKRAAR
jgi:hypothetical protein